MTIGNRIAFYRKKLNITQDALAQKLDVTNQAVSKWESDQCCPDIFLLPKLADIFGISIDELFGRETPPKQEEQTIHGLPWKDDGTLRVVLYVGHRLIKNGHVKPGFSYSYDGPLKDVICAVSIQCGDVTGYVDAGGHVNCGNVGGNVDAGTDITCATVRGDADAGRDIKCGNVGGSVDAGSNACCGDVTGDVDAGGNVECGAVGGNIDAGGQVQCGPVSGDIDAGGQVTIHK